MKDMKFYPNSKLNQYISMPENERSVSIDKTHINLSEEHRERMYEFNLFTQNNKDAFFTIREFNEVMKYPYNYSVSEWYHYFKDNDINEDFPEHEFENQYHQEEEQINNFIIPKNYLIMYEDYTEEEKRIMEEEDKLFEGLAEEFYHYDYEDEDENGDYFN